MAESQDYQVTARKWRPAEFNSVVGQEHVTQTLKNAIKSGRLHHAFLFNGPRGVGKTTTARILAKALNCQNLGEDFEPCNTCESCRQIIEGNSMDVVEIDGASNNSVEDVRKLRDNAKYPPLLGRYKLYVIDEVHMLSTSAFNALLKTLEEPPKHLVFIFATTEPHKVPVTILSRCQRFDFRRMQIEEIAGHLGYIAAQEGFNVDEDALLVIARKGDGSMRDAQSIFDQVISFCGTTVSYQAVNDALNLIDQEFFFRVTDMMREHATAEAFMLVEQIMRTGYDVQEFLIGLSEHLRNFLTVRTTGSAKLIETARQFRERYVSEVETMTEGDLIRALHLVLAAQQAIRSASQPRLRLELTLVQLAVMDSTVELKQLLAKIDGMPQTPHGGGPAAPNATPGSSPPASAAGTGGRSATAPTPPAEQAPARTGSSAMSDIASFPKTSPGGNRSSTIVSPRPSGRPSGGSAGSGGANGSNGGMATMMSNGADGDVAVMDAPGITLTAIQRRWKEFLEHCSDRRSVWAALMDAWPAELYGDTIRLYVRNDSQLMLLRAYADGIAEKLETFFESPLVIEGVVGEAPQPAEKQPGAARADEAKHPEADHPFVRALIEKLGARPI